MHLFLTCIRKKIAGDRNLRILCADLRTLEVLLACISPAKSNHDESISTLEFAAGLLRRLSHTCIYVYIHTFDRRFGST